MNVSRTNTVASVGPLAALATIALASIAALAVMAVSPVSAQSGPKLTQSAMPGFLKSVTANASPTKLTPGGKGTLTVTVSIAAGYHIYANVPGDENAIPTEFTPAPSKMVIFGKPVYPAGTLKDGVRIHQGTMTVSVPFTVVSGLKPQVVAIGGGLRAQGCTDSACLPPATVPVQAAIGIAGGGR